MPEENGVEDELDRMLSRRDEIVPSSGFVSSVMDAVRREAEASEPAPFPPIAFPWVRAIPMFVALAVVVVMLIAGLMEFVRMPADAVSGPLLPPTVKQMLAQANAGWIALALLLAFFAAFLPIRFAAGKR